MARSVIKSWFHWSGKRILIKHLAVDSCWAKNLNVNIFKTNISRYNFLRNIFNGHWTLHNYTLCFAQLYYIKTLCNMHHFFLSDVPGRNTINMKQCRLKSNNCLAQLLCNGLEYHTDNIHEQFITCQYNLKKRYIHMILMDII